jgi:PRC-barrel domain
MTMKTPVYIALAAVLAVALGLSPLARAEGTYGGTYDRGYYRSSTDTDVGMTDATRSDNLDQGRFDNRGMVSGYVPSGSPSVDRTYSDYYTERRGTDDDVGMTDATRSDNLDQGRLDNRGLIGGRVMGSPSIDRGEYHDFLENREARTGNLHELSDMLGRKVTDANGDHLGTIRTFVADDLGRIDFAVVSAGTKDIAVPFQALTYDSMGHYTLNMTEQQLAEAPVFDQMHLADQTWPGTVYRYYGLTPRW